MEPVRIICKRSFAVSLNPHDHLDPVWHGDTVDLFQFLIEGDRPMSITVWAAPASRLQSRHVLRFLTESRSPIRAVEVRLFMYNRTPVGSRRWESIGDLAKTAEDISRYIGDSGSPQATIIRDEVTRPPS
jgi:hypothetical protein